MSTPLWTFTDHVLAERQRRLLSVRDFDEVIHALRAGTIASFAIEPRGGVGRVFFRLTVQEEIYDAFFKSLGAQPLRMAPPDVYTALERNTVEGYGWPLWGIQDFGWDKYTKFRHDPGFISAAVAVIINLGVDIGIINDHLFWECFIYLKQW